MRQRGYLFAKNDARVNVKLKFKINELENVCV